MSWFGETFSGKNFGTTMGGIGALAQAYGAYEMAKTQKAMYEHQKEKDKKSEARRKVFQDEIDDSVANIWA